MTLDFCSGETECSQPNMPQCQDRTILCLKELDIPDGMSQKNITSNETLHDFAKDAQYKYSCDKDGWVIEIPGAYPEELIVTCREPVGYPDEWHYGIWNEGYWEHQVIKVIMTAINHETNDVFSGKHYQMSGSRHLLFQPSSSSI